MVTKARRAGAAKQLYIDEWMSHLGLNDDTLAEKIGTNRVTMWRWRSEQNRLNPLKIARIAKGMGIAPEDLWRPPGRPSLDSLVKEADDETVQRAADVVRIMLKTGS